MSDARIMEIIKRRRSEANDKQIGLVAVGNNEQAQVWWQIMTEYDDLIAEIEHQPKDPER